jgi:ABC-type transport system involved in multi-copper enzyme maturation permease subunit
MIVTFARFDIINFVTPVKRIAPALLLVLVAPAISPWPAFGIGVAAIVMSLLASNPFAADERGRLDTLYATLPISRRSIVIARYLALAVIYVAVALVATVAVIVVTVSQGKTVDFVLLGAVNVASLLIFAIALAVQLPFFFSVGFTRARLMTFIPVVVVVGGAAIASQTGVLNDADVVSEIARNLDTLWVAAPIVAALALAASIVISSTRYGRRAL